MVIPSGILLAGDLRPAGVPATTPPIRTTASSRLAHCTGPRKMDGKKLEPARIMTHFESDYGAAPKVEMPKGQKLTNIAPDFAAKRWVGVCGRDRGRIRSCRSAAARSTSASRCDSLELAQRMPGFHWMTCYGDYLRESGYALRRVGIQWETLG